MTALHEDDDQLVYKVVGGPGDGKKVLRAAMPIKDGERRQIITPDNPYTALLHERKGDELHFIESYEIVVFDGGPLDGTTDTLAHCEAQNIKEGEYAVVLVEGNRYAWYKREGRRMKYSHTGAQEQVETINDEEPGLRIT